MHTVEFCQPVILISVNTDQISTQFGTGAYTESPGDDLVVVRICQI
jgi:hypothetical protein